jgi:hypothetical protein
MTTEISGTVEDAGGNAIQGARVFIVRESDDSVVATETTDSLGEYQVVGLSDFETYFVVAQYDDGSTKYNGTSYPVVTPFTGTGPIDDMEDADIVEYSEDKVSFDIINSPVFEGTNALGMTNDDGAPHLIISQSGLPRYPEEGDTFSFRTYFENSISEMAFLFGVKDANNYYRARVIKSANEIATGKVSGGSTTNFDFAAASIPLGEWLEGIVQWQPGGDIRLTLKDSAGNEIAQTALENDTEFSNESGIGWVGFVDSFSGDAVYYDLAQITQLSGTPEVTTLQPSNVGSVEATFEGDLIDVGSDSSADVFFEWGQQGDGFPNQTAKNAKTTTGVFTHTESGLSDGTGYEYRAVAENSVGKTTASDVQFTTADIPNDVIHQYRAEDYTGGGTWEDNVGFANMDVTDLSQSTLPDGSAGVSNGGTGFGKATGPETLVTDSSFGVAFVFSSTDKTDVTRWAGLDVAGSSNQARFNFSDTDFRDESIGEIQLVLTDSSGEDFSVETNQDVCDGSKHYVICNKTSDGNVDWYVDDMSSEAGSTVTQNDNFNSSNASTGGLSMGFYGRNNDGTIDGIKDFTAGTFEFKSSPYDQTERDNFKTRR